MKSLALTKEWNTTGHLQKGYFVRNEVRLKQLDSIVREPIHLMKIDVEGFEGHVLGGARQLFDRYTVRYIVAEFSPDMLTKKGSDPAKDFLSFFHTRGYEIRHIIKGFNIDHRIMPEEFDTFCRSQPPKYVSRQCELFIHRPEDVDRG